MNQNPQVLERTRSTGGPPEPVRKPILIIVVVVLLAGVGAAVLFSRKSTPGAGAPEVGPAQPSTPTTVQKTPGPDEDKPQETTGAARQGPVAPVQTTVPSVRKSATPADPATPRPEPSPFTRQLVGSLTQLDLSQGPLTQEKADLWKRDMQQLTSQGAGAVPAIREFLEKNLDLSFDATSAGMMGQPSMRLSMLEALQNIGGPDAMALSAQVLQTTLDPREIAWLAQSLEQQAPGQYGPMAMEAAREALAMATAGKLEGRDVGPLFNLLQQHGGADAIADLQGASSQYRYYAAIALANMPDGAGISALVQMVQDPDALSKGGRAPALQMLAEAVFQSPEARQALLEQARLNQIPGSTWVNIAQILAGDKTLIGPAPIESGVRSFHLQAGNQNFYTMPDHSQWPPEMIQRNQDLIQQFMNLDSIKNNQIALQSLQNAFATLQTRGLPR
jgi:hypothetical protein